MRLSLRLALVLPAIALASLALGVTVTAAGTVDSHVAPAAPLPPAQPVTTGMSWPTAQAGWVVGGRICGTHVCAVLTRTVDGGRTWSQVALPASLEVSQDTFPALDLGGCDSLCVSVVGFSAEDAMAVGPRSWVTSDAGRHWMQLPVGSVYDVEDRAGSIWIVTDPCQKVGPLDPYDDVTGCQGLALLRYAGGRFLGSQPSPPPLEPDGLTVSPGGLHLLANEEDSGITIRGHQFGNYLLENSHDGGLHWTLEGVPGCYWKAELEVQAIGPRTLIAVCDSGFIGAGADVDIADVMQSNDDGRTWSAVMSVPVGDGVGQRGVELAARAGLVLLVGDGVVLRLDGAHTTPVLRLTGYGDDDVFQCAEVTNATVAHVADDERIWSTIDAGATWTVTRPWTN